MAWLRAMCRCGGGTAARIVAVLASVLLWPPVEASAQAKPIEVDLLLVLAVDVSRSMDVDEQQLQREGYVGAFRHPEVIAAIEHGQLGRIAVIYVEWAGAPLQQVLVPWTIVDGAAAGKQFAQALASAPIRSLQRTSISSALIYASTLFAHSGFVSERHVIDVSGDGPNNAGLPVAMARDAVVDQGIVINGLPLVPKRSGPFSLFDIPDLDLYYQDCVIGGFGAFAISVADMHEFGQALRRKLILEIAAVRPILVPAQATAPHATSDCLIGEKMWDQFMSGQQ